MNNSNRTRQIGNYTSQNTDRKYNSEDTHRKTHIKTQIRKYNSENTARKNIREIHMTILIEQHKSENTSRKNKNHKVQVGEYNRKGTNQKNNRKSKNRCNLQHCNIANPPAGGGGIRRISRIDLPRSVSNNIYIEREKEKEIERYNIYMK